MYQKLSLSLLLLGFTLISISCETGITGTSKENLPPKTFLTINEINRSEDNRLSSQINISWWGDDPDGFIQGYEYAINDTSEGAWSYTERTDSTFVLPISFGQDVDDVLFKIRAIDDDGAKDPKGAQVVFPIKNTPPTVQVVKTESAPDTTYSIVSFGWVINDPDGFINIERTEVAFNDTSSTWTEIPFQDDDQIFITLEIGDESSTVYRGRSMQQTGISVNGIQKNAENIFFVRTIDQAGASSPIDTVRWFVKEQQSDILFLNDVDLVNHLEVVNFHKEQLNNIGLENVDYWQINDGEFGSGRKVPLSQAFPTVIDPTLRLALSQWKHIYWISSDLDRNITYAQDILSDFFDNGGTAFINIPTKGLSSEDPLFNFLPISRLASFSGNQSGPLIKEGSYLTPVDTTAFPVLNIIDNIVSVYSFEVASGTTPLYEAEMRARVFTGGSEEYNGPKTIALENPEGNLIYFGIDLRHANGNNNVSEFLDQALNNELCFDGACQ